MNDSPPALSTHAEEIKSVLRRHGVLPSSATTQIVALPGNPKRHDHAGRAAFQVSSAGKAICHLTVASDLEPLWNRSQAFYQACPSVACRPFFHERLSDSVEILGREYFEGITIEAKVNDRKLSTEAMHGFASQALNALEASSQPSNHHAAETEAMGLFDRLHELSLLNAFDRKFLHEAIQPIVREGIAKTSAPRTRWTNGDFIARNLLVDLTGNVRLIDYEFAERTHFFAEDLWRWRIFSNLPADMRELPGRPDEESPPAWLEILFWLKQLVLCHDTHAIQQARWESQRAFDRIMALAAQVDSRLHDSIVLRPLITAGDLHAEMDRLRNEHARAADKIYRMQRSRSWRFTAWLRALRRWIEDPLLRKTKKSD